MEQDGADAEGRGDRRGGKRPTTRVTDCSLVLVVLVRQGVWAGQVCIVHLQTDSVSYIFTESRETFSYDCYTSMPRIIAVFVEKDYLSSPYFGSFNH